MPNIKSAIKRVRTNEDRRAQNASVKSAMRSAIKKVEALVVNNDVENAQAALKEAAKRIDKATQSGLIQKNTAARYKSRLAKQVNGLTA
ncbi:30S ribosomal protein S20 [Metabacillus fastidiosus]|uniref:Small ribosomal subunit protein bS20 n=1 Tax=Metabacillus fastidiosus TaxID=1458 RepID=A0ABU6NV26_9BACI|nr:30S ribosomal protein S20 [Metabacillus fastidiosus]MEC2076496.1 30S ribosomal protein S20 [Metabacillus fastidiosus]MED4400999.1 30S ribosomal protein S20 [Metabacillus fastidiosus]MED4453423.1 30S ribosomal protein S20 [Metabacillus fastidiosus]MED4463925.1 30S ribosomal protein S20 [Metabacillus fastidiosus]MED4530783.1 30S ribosomal protein S20 [Metabacillus fastidiosus]